MKELLLRVHKSKDATLMLRLASIASVVLSVLGFIYLMLVCFLSSPLTSVKAAAILAIPFLGVTLIRRLINAPRPYELYDFYESAPKAKHGSSFPSRHAHSAFAIATLLCFFSLPLGIMLILSAIFLCVARVLLGIHFIRDVIAGALTGVSTSLIGYFILL